MSQPPFLYYTEGKGTTPAARGVAFSIESDKVKFEVDVAAENFEQEEISVNTANGFIVVEGKHEDKETQHGYTSRQLTRRIVLPEGFVPDSVEYKLSFDGVLTVTATMKVPLAEQEFARS